MIDDSRFLLRHLSFILSYFECSSNLAPTHHVSFSGDYLWNEEVGMSQAVAQEFEGLVVLFIFDHALNVEPLPCAIHYPYTDSLRLHLSLANLAVTQSLGWTFSSDFRFLSHVFPLDP